MAGTWLLLTAINAATVAIYVGPIDDGPAKYLLAPIVGLAVAVWILWTVELLLGGDGA